MKIKLINHGYTQQPNRAHYNDAGADVYSTETFTLKPNETKAINLKFGIQLPDGFMALVLPRSGHAKRGIISQIPPVDSGYTGPIHAIITNVSRQEVTIESGERIAQIVIMPFIVADFVEETGKERGDGAFNSTGK
jgi:dUTP pyrophosphatase